MKTVQLVIFAFIICNIKLSNAWWDEGHMTVAQIAKNELQKNHPDVWEKVNDIALVIANETDGKSTTWVESACYPDDIKKEGAEYFSNWHFVNKPINNYGLGHDNPIPPTNNAIYALNTAKTVLKFKVSDLSTAEKSLMMRMIIHIIGDIHQPLHSSTYFDDNFPDGDRGGNLIQVTFNNKKWNWHALWDSEFGYATQQTRPITDFSILEQYAQDFTEKWPRSSLEQQLTSQDPEDWAEEAYQIARSVYDYMNSNDKFISAQWGGYAYTQIIQKQIALAGYRLADYLVSIYGKSNEYHVSELLQAQIRE